MLVPITKIKRMKDDYIYYKNEVAKATEDLERTYTFEEFQLIELAFGSYERYEKLTQLYIEYCNQEKEKIIEEYWSMYSYYLQYNINILEWW